MRDFAKHLLSWYERYGRQELPWRQRISPYRVWLSEVMLQQTQVTTVLPYFKKFIDKFPSVEALANAQEDEVLHLWSGLGYYSRARNLHRAAKMIVSVFNGKFPDNVEQLQLLPGVGRSTAGAIAAIAFSQPAPILDGNVKRILARLFTIEGWPGLPQVAHQLWQKAESLTPKNRVNDYTQAIMDLGAMLCTRSAAKCELCPVNRYCRAYQSNCVQDYPSPKPKKAKPIKSVHMLLISNKQHHVLLEKRPSKGVWGGLWSFPECPEGCDIIHWCKEELNLKVVTTQSLTGFRHTFSHYHLDISPVSIKINAQSSKADFSPRIWYHPDNNEAIGLSSPVSRLLSEYVS